VESGIHGFGIRSPATGIRNPIIIVIQNPGCWLWNPESMDVEFRIHRHGIWNPRLSWITFHGANSMTQLGSGFFVDAIKNFDNIWEY